MRGYSLQFVWLTGSCLALAVVLCAQTIQTVAGGMPLPGQVYDASQVRLSGPVAGDGAGNFYVGGPYEVFRISTDGKLSLYAGTGAAANSAGGGPALSTRLAVDSMARDSAGNLYLVDEANGVVRAVDGATGQVSVVAEAPGITSVTVDSAGAVYFGDSLDCSVRRVNPTDGSIQTLVGGCKVGGIQDPAALAVDSQGNLYIADSLAVVVWRWDPATGALTVFAGELASQGQGGTCPAQQQQAQQCPASQIALLASPDALSMDGAGDLFIGVGSEVDKVAAVGSIFSKLATVSESGIWSDAAGDVWAAGPELQRIDGVTGAVAVVAGSVQNDLGDGSTPLGAQLSGAHGLAVDAAGDLFLGGNPIVEVTAAGQVRTVAGGGTGDPSAGPIAAATADLSGLTSIALDAQGHLYAPVNTARQSHIYTIDLSSGLVSNLAGTWSNTLPAAGDNLAADAVLTGLGAIAADGSGNLYFVETQSDEVWEVAAKDGTLLRVAGQGVGPRGGDGGPATSAVLPNLGAIAADASGDLYLSDPPLVRYVDHASGDIRTLAGNGSYGLTGDGGLATAASLEGARGLAVDAGSNLFLEASHTVREVVAASGIIQTLTGLGDQWDPQFSGAAAAAAFSSPAGLVTGSKGNVFFGTSPDEIREVNMQSALDPSVTVLNFGAQSLNATSSALTVTLTNAGGSALGITGISIAGANAADFAQVNTCGATLAAGATCAVSVTFTPAVAGSRAGILEVTDDAAVGTATVALNGSGSAGSLTLPVASLDLGQVQATKTSAAQSLTLSNPGTATVTISSVAATGNFAETNTCGSSLAAGAQCTISVTFTPPAAVNSSGQLTVNFPGGSQAVALSGEGVDFELQAGAGGNEATAAAGQAATYQLNFQMDGSLSGTLTSACSVAPTTNTIGCTTSPASGTQLSYTAGAPTSVAVDITTQARSVLPAAPPGAPPGWAWPLMITGTLLAMGGLVRERRRWVPALGLGMVLVLGGCGGGGGSSPPPPPPPAATGTPAGTYSITVTLKVGPVTHAVPLTLVVQ